MTQSFKKIGFAILFTALSVVSLQAQTAKKAKPVKHVCNSECTTAAHMYKHGEKKHVCGDACKTAAGTMELKDHVCTDACHSSGKCVKVHGEKGHTCDATCKSHM